ncbi:MAG: class I SAM-dependent methyltransferase [Anaerolineae bacterium]
MTSAPSQAPRETWRKYMHEYNEGLGLVYERIVLNDFLDQLMDRHTLHTVVEAPIYGMAGVSGINSVRLAQRGAAVTLVDCDAERLDGVHRIWNELQLTASFYQNDFLKLPFEDRTFDLAWNWAALWHIPQPEPLIKELVRVSRQFVFIAMPNRVQVGYLLRKYILERDFVNYVDESWADIRRVKRILQECGARIIDEGVLDVPPWPDTVMPAAQVLSKFGLRSKQFEGNNWNWSSMDYYLGKRPELKARIERYAFLEHAPIPWQIKSVWAHHRYVLVHV